jgi:hypothetical protein
MIRAYANGEKYGMNRIQYILHNLKSFAEDAQFAISGESRPKHDGVRRMTRKIHKKVIKHVYVEPIVRYVKTCGGESIRFSDKSSGE